jgi:hypothetical protein
MRQEAQAVHTQARSIAMDLFQDDGPIVETVANRKWPDARGDQLSDSLIENISRKVLYCSGCETAEFENEHIPEIKGENGKDYKHCPWCGERLTMRSQDRIHSSGDGKVLAPDISAPRDSVTRLFTSPWGKVKAHISVHSYFAPFIELNGVNSPAIKRLIDEEFSTESIAESSKELPPSDVWQYLGFVDHLKQIVAAIHRDPNAIPELDYDKVQA